MDFETIRYELDGGVLTLTLNRPDRLNAFNNTMMHEMIAALDAADADAAAALEHAWVRKARPPPETPAANGGGGDEPMRI